MLPYAIVKFPIENTIGVFCTKWLDREEKTCKYPTSKAEFLNITRILKKECDSSPDWENHPVVVLGQYETYAEAKRQEQKAEDTSNLSDDDENITVKRRRKPNSKYEDMNDDSRSPSPPPKKSKTIPPKHPSLTSFSPSSLTSSSISCTSPQNYPKPLTPFRNPPSNNQVASTSLHLSLYSDFTHQTPNSHLQQLNIHSPSPYSDHDFTYQTPNSHLQQPTIHSPSHDFTYQTQNSYLQQPTIHSPSHDFTPPKTHETPTSRRQQPTTQQSHLQKPTSEDVIDKLNHLISMVAAFNNRMDTFEKKLDLLADSRATNKENRPEEEIFKLLPIKTMDGFDEYGKKLTEDEGFRKSFVKAMSALGGRDPNSLTINVMKLLLTDKAAELFSLTGKKMGNFPAKKKFIDTKICISVFDAVR